jgi:hypothetical protein
MRRNSTFSLTRILSVVDPAIPLWIFLQIVFQFYGSYLFPGEVQDVNDSVDSLISSATDENSDLEIKARSHFRSAKLASALFNLSLVSLLSIFLSTLFLLSLRSSLSLQSFLLRILFMVVLLAVAGIAYYIYSNQIYNAQMTLVSEDE